MSNSLSFHQPKETLSSSKADNKNIVGSVTKMAEQNDFDLSNYTPGIEKPVAYIKSYYFHCRLFCLCIYLL